MVSSEWFLYFAILIPLLYIVLSLYFIKYVKYGKLIFGIDLTIMLYFLAKFYIDLNEINIYIVLFILFYHSSILLGLSIIIQFYKIVRYWANKNE